MTPAEMIKDQQLQKDQTKPSLTVSEVPNTTVNMIEVKVPVLNYRLVDTPGIPLKNNLQLKF